MLTGSPEHKDQADELLLNIQALLVESQEEMRTMIRALRPATDQHFVAALEERIHALQLQHETHLQLTQQGCESLTLPGHLREALLRATDEALQNALKHARATHVFVSLQRHEDELVVTVSDDGRGFHQSNCQRGLGMNTMKERMETVGGTMRMKSAPGAGTTIEFVLRISCKSEG